MGAAGSAFPTRHSLSLEGLKGAGTRARVQSQAQEPPGNPSKQACSFVRPTCIESHLPRGSQGHLPSVQEDAGPW